MKVLTITQVLRNPALFREELQKDAVHIVWKEPKPNGKVVFEAIAKQRGKNNENTANASE